MEVPKGHLGLKSSPFAPTDCNLTSQYMVVDHMVAHYKKVNNARSTIDNGPPKAWLVSQKVRDQARRHALTSEIKRHNNWVKSSKQNSRAPSQASSDVARDEMLAMMESLGDYDEVDARFNRAGAEASNTTMEVHASDVGPDMDLINRIIADHQNSPSKYHNPNKVTSNIPQNNSKRPSSARHTDRSHSGRTGRRSNTSTPGQFNATTTIKHVQSSGTPHSIDVMETQAHKFTEERPFQPRINKASRPSKLAEYKCYNGPRKSADVKNRTITREGSTRPVTPLTESADLMNASLMSRDLTQMRTPTGVPPLDISLDGDHMNWLKEQSKKAQLRSTYIPENKNGQGEFATTQPYGPAGVTGQLSTGEEELKYLQFITEVTNDVLDRGIFTNRVLKQVFHSHIQRRKHDLKVSRMRELLDELRKDLGIPNSDSDSEEGFGLTSTLSQHLEDTQSKSIKFTDLDNNVAKISLQDSRPSRKRDMLPAGGGLLNGTLAAPFDPLLMTTKKFDMATLRQASRTASQERVRSPSPSTGRPPIPKVNPRSATSRSQGSVSRENSYEEDDLLLANKTYTSLDGIDSLKVTSKPDEDLSAYSQNIPMSWQRISPTREIGPIEEVRESARTEADTSRTEGEEETAHSESSTACSGKETDDKEEGMARSVENTDRSQAESVFSKENTARSQAESVFSKENTARSQAESVFSKEHTDHSERDTARSYISNLAEYEEDFKTDMPETERSSPPKPTPRKRTSRTSSGDDINRSVSQKSSLDHAVNSMDEAESVIASEIDEDF